MAPLVDLGIHVGRTAQHLSTRSENATPLHSRLRFAFKRPIERCLEELQEAGRNRNESAGGRSARLDKQDSKFSRTGQPLGEHAPGGTSSHDDKFAHFSVLYAR
jgi:hypothetical protein